MYKNLAQRKEDLKNFSRNDFKDVRDYVNSGTQSDLKTLAHVANTASAVEQFHPGNKGNLQKTGMMYDVYNKNLNRGGSSRKMRSYRNKSNKRNKRNKRTGRTRRGKRRLH
jgi:hypothetical protein